MDRSCVGVAPALLIIVVYVLGPPFLLTRFSTRTNFVVFSYMRNFSPVNSDEIPETKPKWCRVKLHGSGLELTCDQALLIVASADIRRHKSDGTIEPDRRLDWNSLVHSCDFTS